MAIVLPRILTLRTFRPKQTAAPQPPLSLEPKWYDTYLADKKAYTHEPKPNIEANLAWNSKSKVVVLGLNLQEPIALHFITLRQETDTAEDGKRQLNTSSFGGSEMGAAAAETGRSH